jgi:cytochrome o ubiquinol oxidase subunit 2
MDKYRGASIVINVRRVISTAVFLSLPLILTGCRLALLDPKGIIAADEKHIMLVSALLMLLVVIPVILLSFVFAWRYRASNTKAAYTPDWAHSTLLEVVWWSIPCIIIAILASITWVSSHTLDPYRAIAGKDDKTLTIQAVSLQWKWLFIYPDQNIATVNFIQFPVGVPVKLVITAEGPMNSIQIPQLAGQIYAMAGMKTKLHILASEAGDYNGISANFTGDGFSEMKFIARASTQVEFDAWVKTVKQSANKLTLSSYNQLLNPSINDPVKYYSSAYQDMFTAIVMKTMMPMPASTPAKEAALVCNTKSKNRGI